MADERLPISSVDQLLFDTSPMSGAAAHTPAASNDFVGAAPVEMPKENISLMEKITAHPDFAQLIEQKAFDPFKTRVQGKDQSRVPPGPMASLQRKP